LVETSVSGPSCRSPQALDQCCICDAERHEGRITKVCRNREIKFSRELILYAITAVMFLTIDCVMLTLVMKPIFTRHLGDAMQDSPMLAPAGLFYLAYVASLVFLVSIPVLRDAATGRAAPHGAIIRAMAYGAYKFTSMSIMKAL
jgi:uncharacterized membrane protein